MASPEGYSTTWLSPAALLFRPPGEETEEDREARATARALAAKITSRQRPAPKDLVGYLQRFDSPDQEEHTTFGILHKTDSIHDSEMKIIAGFDTIITPRRSEGSSEGKFVLQRANKAKRGSHIPKEQWIATRFLSMDVSQSLRDEKLLPIQIVHFSYPLKHSRWRLAAVLTQYLFTAVDDGKFLTNRLPSFIQDFWRIASSDPIVVTASTETEGSILTFGEVSVSWAPGQSAEGKILRHMTFYGAALGQSFGLLLNMSDEDYKTLYFSEIEPFAGEMGVALEVFLAAEDHLRRRRWSHNEQHRMDVLLKRFEDKVESDLKDAREIWESNQAGEGSSSGAAAKKNRKEKERRARRKREAQASAASALPEMVPTEVGSPEVGEDEEVQGVEANRDSSIDASTNEKGENVKGKGKAVDRQGDDAPEQSGTAAHLEEAVENESLRLSKTETPIEEELPEAASSKSTAKHAILHAQPHNIPNLTLIEPHQPQTQREHQPQLTITSSTPSSTHHKSTIRTSTSTASRPLMTPAIPYNLHLPKKSSAITREATMQEHTSDKQQPESVREMQAPDSQQHPEIEQSQHSDMPQSATSHILPSNSLQPATEHEVEQSLHSDMPHPATSHTLPSNSLQPATEQESHAATPHLPTTEQEPQAETQQLPSTDQQIQPSQAQPSSSTQTRQHLIQFDTYQWLCRNQECRKSTSPYDGSTVICPRCGPYSLVRYCSKKCLFEDLLIHWGAECGEYPLTQKADLLTIERRQINILPALPDLDNINRPERHRQLVRHSLDNTTADYFIFSDWLQWRAEGFPLPWPPTKICSGIVLVPLNFTTAGSSVPNKLFFTRLLRLCFLVPVTRADMTYALFKMIRGRLDELGLATADALNCLTWQFKHEFGFGPGFAELLLDRQQVNWPLVAGEIMALEGQYGGFLSGAAGLGVEWTNEV